MEEQMSPVVEEGENSTLSGTHTTLLCTSSKAIQLGYIGRQSLLYSKLLIYQTITSPGFHATKWFLKTNVSISPVVQ